MTRIYQLTAEFLRTLEAEHPRLGVDQHQRVQALLSRLPEDISSEQLKLVLVPLFARSPEEQEQLYALFDQCVERVAAVNEPIAESEATEEDREERQLRWSLWLMGFLLLAALAIAFYLTRQPASPEEFYQSYTIPASQTTEICPDTLTGFGNITAAETCTIRIDSTISGSYTLSPNACLSYTAKNKEGIDLICVNIQNGAGEKAILYLTLSIEIEQPRIVEESSTPLNPNPDSKVDDENKEEEKAAIVFNPKSYPHATDIHNLLAPTPTAPQPFLKRHQYWLRPLLMLLLGAFLYLLLRWRQQRRQILVAERSSGDRPPYIWNIELEDVAADVDLGENYPLLLNQLRRRATDDFSRIDIPATINATVEESGLPTLRYAQQTRPPEYLLLIDRHSAQNHRAKLFDLLYRVFREQEVIIERFFYDGDPRVVYQESDARLGLADLRHRFPQARLLLLGNGYQLLSPLSGKPAKWTQTLAGWPQRALLSPQPTNSWGRRERLLSGLLPVLPASLQSLYFLVDQFDAQEEPQWGNWREAVEDAPAEPIVFKGSLLSTLQQHYGKKMVQWIAACAVYPALHWDLTLYLGRLLSTEEKNLLTVNQLLDLNRLPWFIEGEIPNEARSTLLGYLEREAPEVLDQVRLNLHQILLQNPPPADSVANDDYQMNLALNEWQNTKDSKQKKELEKQIAELLEQGIEADFTVLKYLKKERSPLDFVVPDRWKKYVHPEGFPALGWKPAAKDLWWAGALWAILAAILAFFPLKIEECTGHLTPFSENLLGDIPIFPGEEGLTMDVFVDAFIAIDKESSIELCLSTTEDSVLYYEYMARVAVRWADRIGYVDSISQWVIQSTAQDSVKRIYRENVAVAAYNTGMEFWLTADSLMKVASEINRNAEGPLRDAQREYIYTQQQLKKLDSRRNNSILEEKYQDRLNALERSIQNLTERSERKPLFDTTIACPYFNLSVVLDSVDLDYQRALQRCQPETEVAGYQIAPEIRGQVLDELNRPLSGVAVSGQNVNRSTGQDGGYTLQLPPDYPQPNIRLTFSKPGYLPATQTFTVDGVTALPILQLTQEAPDAQIIRVQILDTLTRRPLAGVQANFGTNASILTDSTGVFELPVPADADVVEMNITHEGYQPTLGIWRAGEPQNIQIFLQPTIIPVKRDSSLRFRDIPDLKINPSRIIPTTTPDLQTIPGNEVDLNTLPAAIQKLVNDMVNVQGGTFTMGSSDREAGADECPHPVTVGSFSIGKYEVTQAQWRAVMDNDPSYNEGCDECPVERVSWNDIQDFLEKLNTLTGQEFRLPTEAEWEFAAKGGMKSRGYKYAGSNDIDQVAWYFSNYKMGKREGKEKTTHPVGQKTPNELELYDMSGNVWEWCQDTYQPYPNCGGEASSRRVLRGGSWYYFVNDCRSADRNDLNPDSRGNDSGFRLSRAH